VGVIMADSEDNIIILRHAIDEAIESLGGPIHKTITWHMNNRGIFADSKIDINSFYSNLKELVGPGADLIMEETWEQMEKQGVAGMNFGPKMSPLEKIQKIMKIGESA
jgi:hypothetical protein